MGIKVIAAAATLALAAQVAAAEPAPGRQRQPDAAAAHRQARAGGEICPRICPRDTTPCDPISFKIADGRCNPMAVTGP
ncbi:hypothetical protein [Chelatococcus reniformis]|uniref:Kazal-like domain-containing protein n=1 Tax=Chelatococcus reniformis TaxID=1494448 RepID=A0A916UN78_9HYPH|nr:hypothetical protein [Chelatococcus reniformis]GGC77048.1 hypothetical protein GCM10010994_39190 [Chelatococcus reniformis]